ncbi:hypothetical protein B0I35DRAFT_202208 [Stachybotrys elegans]|uniref:Uncharacterized protein n=1 Tax=Stachybotrys elegans TaxID=80388 RepID=A0A8K0WTS9_9HYPO|nr:hypothetical protein B0I35DRAFT_202208 [Stachybotrys elegans]
MNRLPIVQARGQSHDGDWPADDEQSAQNAATTCSPQTLDRHVERRCMHMTVSGQEGCLSASANCSVSKAERALGEPTAAVLCNLHTGTSTCEAAVACALGSWTLSACPAPSYRATYGASAGRPWTVLECYLACRLNPPPACRGDRRHFFSGAHQTNTSSRMLYGFHRHSARHMGGHRTMRA